MSNKTINVAEDFSRYPAGRYYDDGPYSGQKFREEYLVPVITNNEKAIINLDGVRGYGSSFLEEAFGGLVREGHTVNLILNTFTLNSSDSSLTLEIKDYIEHGSDSNM